MDLVHDNRASMIVEDRLSNLPDDLIHIILSFLDLKEAIQTSELSPKWKHIWTTMPHLKVNGLPFSTLPPFAKFVKHLLSHRHKNHAQVSTVELTFTRPTIPFAAKSIIDYAYSQNVRRLTITWVTRRICVFPQYLFSSHTLKHLTLICEHRYPCIFPGCYISKSAWDFPVLETLTLRDIRIGGMEEKLDLFSECVNLKDLTLHCCSSHGVKIFNICAPQLSNLAITGDASFAEVFNVVAPQLENLTLTVSSASCFNFLEEVSQEGSISIEKVNLSLPEDADGEIYYSVLLELFQKLRSAHILILDMEIIETLSSCLDQLSHEPCPFNNLKCLKINTVHLEWKDLAATIPTQVRNYFLENSPNATIIMDIPQVLKKRSSEQLHNDAKAKKVAKLEAGKEQPETITEVKSVGSKNTKAR